MVRRSIRITLSAILLAACGQSPAPPVAPTPPAAVSASPPASPPLSPGPSADVPWAVAEVANPSAVTEAPSVAPGQFCSPCHPAAQSQLFGVAATTAGLVAVGVQEPPPRAIVFESSDGASWRPAPGFDPSPGSAALAVAATRDAVVVVGRDEAGAAAWTRDDDGTWRNAAGGDLSGAATSSGMISVAAVGDGFVAGGYADDPAAGTTAAAVWVTRDGLVWRRERSDTFAGGRILGLAAGTGRVVAVGTVGDPVRGPAGAWLRVGDGPWRRASIDDDVGVMRAIVAAPSGFIAVGDDPGDRTAVVWRSADGATWTRVPPEAARRATSGPIRMLSVAADGDGLVAAGWRSDAANGSAVTWLSADGATWRRTDWLPSFSGGQMADVAIAGDLLVGVGRTGYPDNNQATIWTAPRP